MAWKEFPHSLDPEQKPERAAALYHQRDAFEREYPFPPLSRVA